MKGEHNNIIYTAKDIEQYLSGKLSSRQMHAMEKAALDDPFLAEAMEGYQGRQADQWEDQLLALHKQIGEKGSVAKVIPLHKSNNNWRKIAAAILIIGSGATLTYVLTNKSAEKGSTEIAQTVPDKDTVQQTASEPVTSVTSVTASLTPTATEPTKELTAANGPIAEAATVKGNTQILTLPVAEPVVTADNNVSGLVSDNTKSTAPASAPPVANYSPNNAQLSEVVSNGATRQDSKNDDGLMSRQRNQTRPSARKEAVLNNYFTAQVVGPDNTPLPFTNISIKKDNFGTYADAKGMVRLISTDSILNVEVRSVGYQPKLYSLRNNQAQTKIVLQEDETEQKDKVVIGKTQPNSNQRSRRASVLTDSAVNVEPRDGWDNYNTYVANNLDIPEDVLKRDIRGEVELSFDVKANGTITNVKVNKSLGAEYDEAAKRLIMEGPQWKVKKGKKTSASVKVQF